MLFADGKQDDGASGQVAAEHAATPGSVRLGASSESIRRRCTQLSLDMDDDSGWMTSSPAKALHSSYRPPTASPPTASPAAASTRTGPEAPEALDSTGSFHGFKFKFELEAPLWHIICLFREFDLISTWNKYIPESTILGVESLMSIDVRASLWLPFPFENRLITARAEGIDALDEAERAFIIMARSLRSEEEAAYSNSGGKGVPCLIRDTGIRLRPLPPNELSGAARTGVTVWV